nr:RluA family pseudouridine synthase [Portibacter lacus]
MDHNFGLDDEKQGLVIGKMFGVLVVENAAGEIGYLKAFSGKLANANHHMGFVPPVFDMLTEKGFFKKEEEVISSLNFELEIKEEDVNYINVKKKLEELKLQSISEIAAEKQRVKDGKKSRKIQRAEAKTTLSNEEFEVFNEVLRLESIKSNFSLRDLIRIWAIKIEEAETEYNKYAIPIQQLREERKKRSSALQNQLFDSYTFLNAEGDKKSLLTIFENTISNRPPAGAGECAAPKLLQYAFLNDLKPITMAEFWWGQSPSAEVRMSETFYPACRGKCEPILGHMLSATNMDPNPMLENPALGKTIKIVYEDDDIAIINKPAEFLSVPGKNIVDSVYARLKILYPKAEGPLLVHRLDMSTSGIMIMAKNLKAHKFIQQQFIKREVYKRYVAILEGEIKDTKGFIDLPLRVDLNDRPRQLVCYEHGKSARTKWKVVEVKDKKTRIHFIPLTGRTHQLRVHAAHSKGLFAPIVGDDLYGTKKDRLLLHAESIIFIHPTTRKEMKFKIKAPF